MNRNKRMIKTTMIYFIGNFGSKLLSFFLLPLYTSVLEPERFGSVDLILSVVPLIGPVFTLQTTESIFRFLFNCKNEQERKKAITSAFFIYLVGIGAFLICFIPYAIVTDFAYTTIFCMYFIALYLGIFNQQVLRGIQKNVQYAITGVLSTFVQAIVNIALIHSLKETSLLIAPLVASIVISVYGIWQTKLWEYIDFKCLTQNEIKKQLKYSLPLVPNQICWWFNGIVGKYIVNHFVGISANGIIALATRFPNLVSVVMQIYFLAWTENSIYEIDSEDKDEYFSENFNGLLLFLIVGISGLILIIRLYMEFMVSDQYEEANRIIPLLFISMLLNAAATFLGTVYTASMKTKDAFSTTIYAAIANIVSSFILIPIIGIYGYPLANIISYGIFVLVRLESVKKFVNITIYFSRMVLPLILLSCSMIAYYCFKTSGIIILLIIEAVIVMYFGKKYLFILIKKIKKG